MIGIKPMEILFLLGIALIAVAVITVMRNSK